MPIRAYEIIPIFAGFLEPDSTGLIKSWTCPDGERGTIRATFTPTNAAKFYVNVSDGTNDLNSYANGNSDIPAGAGYGFSRGAVGGWIYTFYTESDAGECEVVIEFLRGALI